MMTTRARKLSDQAAIGLSGLCTLHCLALPLVLTLLPSALAITLGSEAFHLAMIAAVIPTSVYALTVGCKQHQRYRLLVLGGAGLLLLIGAALGEHYISEWQEKALTVAGALLLAASHALNYHQCKQHDDCHCPSNQ